MSELRKWETKIPYRVPYADTDKMGIVYYANYFVYFERIRNEMIRRGEFSYKELEEKGYYLPVVEAHSEYLLPARYDDLLDIYGWFVSQKGSRIRIDYEIKRENTLLVEGYTVHAVVDGSGRPRRVPDILQDYIAGP